MNDARLPSLRTALDHRPVAAAIAAALVVRIALDLWHPFAQLTNDSQDYIDSGVNLVTRGTFAMTCDPSCVPTMWRTPGYPLLIGLVVGGLKLPLGVVFALQACFDAASALLAAAMAWAIAGRRAGVAAAFIHALNPFSAASASVIMTEALISLVAAVAVYWTWRLATTGGHARGWVALGLWLGFASLVRPVFAVFPAALAIALVTRPLRETWRPQLRRWTLAAIGVAAVLGPWVARNWLVTRDGRADDTFHVMASTTSPFYRRLATPGLVRWYQTYEEPFIWDRPHEAPALATYFVPDEKKRLEAMFTGVREADRVTPELDAQFDRLAGERIAAHPFRTRVLPPLTRAIRLWVTPRLSALGIEAARLSGARGKLLLGVTTLYNAVLATIGFGTGLLLVRRVAIRLLLAVPVFLTAVHAVIMWGNQSRYVVPAFPELTALAAIGVVWWWDRGRGRVRGGRGLPAPYELEPTLDGHQ